MKREHSRRAMGTVVLAVSAALLPASAFAHDGGNDDSVRDAAHGRTRIIGFDHDRTTVTLGRKVRDRVVVTPKTRRAVVVQARRPGSSHFVTQSRGHSSVTGAFTATYAPTIAGTWQYRLKVLRNTHLRASTSDTRVVKAVDLTAPSPVTGLRLADISVDSVALEWDEHPRDKDRDKDFAGVTIRRSEGLSAPTSPVDGTTVEVTDTDGTTDKDVSPDTPYTYAVFAHDSSGNYSRPTVITVRTGRFGVTRLEAMSVKRDSVTLAWENPTDAAFTGVIIRRAEGPTPPATPADGTPVDDVTSPEDMVIDTEGLNAGTTYSYAVFAHDGAEHVAAGVTTTVTTPGNGISPMLAVNPLPSVHTGERVTVDTPVAFDGSDSLPALGADLVAWEISYGDHISESYNGPVSSFDTVNTTHAFTEAGPHTVTLTVTDSKGNTDSTQLTVDVFEAPEVSISATNDSPEAGPVPFEVKAETPQDTEITSYRWEIAGDDSFFVDGDSAPATSQEIEFDQGSYTVILTATNDAGGTAASEPVRVEVW